MPKSIRRTAIAIALALGALAALVGPGTSALAGMHWS